MILSNRFKITYGVIIGIALIALFVRVFAFPLVSLAFQVKLFFCSILIASILWETIRGIHLLLNRYYPFSRGVVRRIVLQMLIGQLFMLLYRQVLLYLFADQLPFNITREFRIAVYFVDMFVIATLNFGYFASYFFEQWKASIQRADRLEKEKAVVQFDNLKNQLNPHFLFNALTSLNSLIHEDQELASRFLQHLSKVYRYVLQHKEKELVPLRTELEFIKNFVFLIETRFGSAITIRFEVDEQELEKGIVPVTLQNLLENALKHNVITQQRPLHIGISAASGELKVQNNRQPKNRVEASNKQGLENLRTLYHYLSPNPVQILEDEANFTIILPLI